MSYFAIERNGKCWSPVVLMNENGEPIFNEFLDMDYEGMRSSARLEEFVVVCMNASNDASGTSDDQTIVTLIGDDDVFIWSVMMGPSENDDIKYNLVDWKKDGRTYRYAD